MKNLEKSALVVIDIQVDFCPGGSLAVNGGNEIVDPLNNLLFEYGHQFEKIVFTSDWHPAGHISFASFHKKDLYTVIKNDNRSITLWPDHCIGGTAGAEFYPGLMSEKADLLIRKGRNPEIDSYSAFYENDRETPTGLTGYLKEHGIENVFLCGLAFDWCVFFSAVDSLKKGFKTYVIKDLTRAIDLPSGYANEKEKQIIQLGGKIIDSIYFKAGHK